VRTFFTALLATTAIAAAAPAAAQESAAFTGPHVEAIVGGDRVQGGNDHDDGLLYGVAGGWDFALGNAMRAGIEVEATDSTQKDCFAGSIRAGDRLCARAGRDLYVGGRIGAVVGSSTLLYAKAGYSNAQFRVRYDSGLPTGSYRASDELDGVRLGAGVEHMLGRNAFVKAEYRYSNYEAGGERHQLLGGVGYRF
jgi:outer membrane immunogenic protein